MIKSLVDIAKKEAKATHLEIFSLNYEDKKYWVKKARATIPNKIQNSFYRFLPLKLLIPSLFKNKKEALEYEVSKIEKFKSLGINVPNMLYKCEEFFILKDSGKSVNAFLRDENISKEKFNYFVEKLLIELSKIHNLKEFHGGSQTRNFTYKNEKVFVIDFEESFPENVDIKSLQYRDFLLFLLSFIKIKEPKFEVDYEFILRKYEELTENKDIIKELKKFSKRLSFFIWLSEISFVKKRIGTDVINFFKLFKILNSMEK